VRTEPAGMAGEKREEIELLAGQLDKLARDPRLVMHEIEMQLPHL